MLAFATLRSDPYVPVMTLINLGSGSSRPVLPFFDPRDSLCDVSVCSRHAQSSAGPGSLSSGVGFVTTLHFGANPSEQRNWHVSSVRSRISCIWLISWIIFQKRIRLHWNLLLWCALYSGLAQALQKNWSSSLSQKVVNCIRACDFRAHVEMVWVGSVYFETYHLVCCCRVDDCHLHTKNYGEV